MRFENAPILWILLGIGLIALSQAVRAWLGYRQVRRDARAEFDYRERERMRGTEIGYDRFERAFTRAFGPRAALYGAIGTAAIVALTPLALRLADLIMKGVWVLSGEDRTWEPPFLVYQVGVFFLTIASWALIGYFTARAYHRGVAVSFEEELRREAGLL